MGGGGVVLFCLGFLFVCLFVCFCCFLFTVINVFVCVTQRRSQSRVIRGKGVQIELNRAMLKLLHCQQSPEIVEESIGTYVVCTKDESDKCHPREDGRCWSVIAFGVSQKRPTEIESLLLSDEYRDCSDVDNYFDDDGVDDGYVDCNDGDRNDRHNNAFISV